MNSLDATAGVTPPAPTATDPPAAAFAPGGVIAGAPPAASAPDATSRIPTIAANAANATVPINHPDIVVVLHKNSVPPLLSVFSADNATSRERHAYSPAVCAILPQDGQENVV